MGIFSKLKKIFISDTKMGNNIRAMVTCNSCETEFDSFFRKNYDMQSIYTEQNYDYLINKKLICPKCYKTILLRVELDDRLNIINSKIDEGTVRFNQE